MSILEKVKGTLIQLVLGDTRLPQEFTIGMLEPQTEVSLWLHGMGAPQEVTGWETTACTAPLILAICFHDGTHRWREDFQNPVLRFCESGGAQRVLGEIRLTFKEAISIGSSEYALYSVRGSANHCLPRLRLWAQYALQAYSRWQRNDPADIKMTLVEERAACVTFIRPHFLSLVSIGDEKRGNIFPMNLMGELGSSHFGFALTEQRRVAHQVERAGRLVVSGVPLDKCPVAFGLVPNHRREFFDWCDVAFPVEPSSTFQIPVPSFATRVREMLVERVHPIGSHRFFIARIVSDEVKTRSEQACVVHGFYEFLRLKGNNEALKAAVVADTLHKTGV
jgi:hypothetical protein